MASTNVTLNTRNINKIQNGMDKNVSAALQKMAQDCETYAKNEAPVDTGTLKNSIMAEPDGKDWICRDGVEYGVHQEFGTMHMDAQPFMLPAVRSVEANLPKEILAKVVTP